MGSFQRSRENPEKMAEFVGKFVVESKDNYEAFMKGAGVPDEYIAMSRDVKVVTEIKDGDSFTITRVRPQKTTSNCLVLGQECEIDTIKGTKVKVTASMEDGKIVANGPKYNFVMEMSGGKLKETITF